MVENDQQSQQLVVIEPRDLEKSINGFNAPLSNYLNKLGLPTENILYSVGERKKVLDSLDSALSMLPLDEREKAYYLTKFTVAIAVGLFDSALNFLWNETIKALRKMISEYDLEYFFSVLEKVSGKYKKLNSIEEFDEISDHDLLEACRRMGLMSEVVHKKIEHINYMRNHVSAAHPNDNEINGFEILGWLENCIKYAILAEPDHSAIMLKRLLANMRSEIIPDSDFCIIGQEICRLSQERIDDLLWNLFGMYTDPQLAVNAKQNISKLSKRVWDASTENRKFEVGSKFGVFRKNAEVIRRNNAEEFLGIVNGLQYKDEDSLAAELIEKLGMLKSIHFNNNNFYNEYPCVLTVDSSIPPNGVIPRAVRNIWVKVIGICAIGNGRGYKEGVDESAMVYYNKYISTWGDAEIAEFLNLMNDVEFTTDLHLPKPEARMRKLSLALTKKASNVYLKRGLELINSSPEETLHKIYNTTEFQDILRQIPKGA